MTKDVFDWLSFSLFPSVLKCFSKKDIKTNYVYIVRYKALARLYDTIISVICGPEKMLSEK